MVAKDYFRHHLHTFVSISRVIVLVSSRSPPPHSRHRYRVTEPPIVSAVSEQGSGVINRVGRMGGGAHMGGRISFTPPLLSSHSFAFHQRHHSWGGGGPNAPPKCSVWLRRRQKKLFYAHSRSDISLIKDGSCSDSVLFAVADTLSTTVKAQVCNNVH